MYYCSLLLLSHQSINATLYYILFVCVCFLFPFILDRHQVRWTLLFVVVFFTLLTDRASTVPSNIRGCQFDTWSAGQKKIRGTSTKLQREQNQKQKTKNKTKQNRNDKKKETITKIHMPEKDRTSRGHTNKTQQLQKVRLAIRIQLILLHWVCCPGCLPSRGGPKPWE